MVTSVLNPVLTPVMQESLMLVEVAIKKLIRTDLVATKKLEKIQGKVLAVELTSPSLTFYVLPVSDGLEFSFEPQQADCTLRGSWVDFLEIAEDEHRLFRSDVEILGDHRWVVELKSILTALDVDWEALLADVIGDMPAHQVAKGMHAAKVYAEQTSTLLAQDISDYIHEELRLLPTQIELQAFYHSVDEMRLAADRLKARIDALDDKKECD